MIKYSAAYIPVNPDFVISDIDKQRDVDDEILGVTAMIYNISSWGVPTNPSVYLENTIGQRSVLCDNEFERFC